MQHFSNAQMIAAASASIDAYQHSAYSMQICNSSKDKRLEPSQSGMYIASVIAENPLVLCWGKAGYSVSKSSRLFLPSIQLLGVLKCIIRILLLSKM